MLALRSVAGTSPAVAQRFPSVLAVAGRGAQERRAGRPAATAGLHRAAGRSARDGRQRRRRRRRPSPAVAAPPRRSPAPRRRAGRQRAEPGRGRGRAGHRPRAAAQHRRHAAAVGPAAGMDRRQVGRAAPRDVQRRQPLREDRRPRRELHPVRRQGDGLHLLPPDRRPVERAPALHLRDGRSAQGAGQVRLGEARRVQDRRRSATEGYTTAGSTLFYAGQYYTQIVSTKDDPKFAAFALELAKRVAARQKPGAAPAPGSVPRPAAPASRRPQPATATAGRPRPRRAAAAKPAAAGGHPGDATSPCCRPRAGRATPSTSPRTSSAIASSPTSSWPITRTETSPGRASSAPTATPRRPRRCFEKYIAGVKKDGAEVKTLTAEGADEMVISTNIGLVDVVFRKGNTLAGANGATSRPPGRGLRPRAGQEPAGHRADPRKRQVTESHPTRGSTIVGAVTTRSAATATAFRGETLTPQPRPDDGRKTDPDAT